jgi:hypothetical protein
MNVLSARIAAPSSFAPVPLVIRDLSDDEIRVGQEAKRAADLALR